MTPAFPATDPVEIDGVAALPVAAPGHDGEYQYTDLLVFRTIEDADWSRSDPAPVVLRAQLMWPNARATNPAIAELGVHQQPPWPIVVVAHGGGWKGGDLEGTQELAAALAIRGMVCVNVEYRLPILNPLRGRLRKQGGAAAEVVVKASFPGAVRDVKAAVRYARAHAAAGLLRVVGDSDLVGVCGASAGANLMGVLAVTDPARIDAADVGGSDLEGLSEPGIDDAGPSPSVQSSGAAFAILISAPMPDLIAQLRFARRRNAGSGLAAYVGKSPRRRPDVWAAASPRTYLIATGDVRGTVGLPPFLLVHAKGDTIAPHSGMISLRNLLGHAGGTVQLREFGIDANHSTWRKRLDTIATTASSFVYERMPAKARA